MTSMTSMTSHISFATRLRTVPFRATLATLVMAAPAAAQTLVSLDPASLSRTVGDERAIESVTISSTPSIDADGDGTGDTYGAGDRIVVDVAFNGFIVATGDDLPGRDMGVRLRLDLGTDDANPKNSRRVLVNPVVVNHTTLRFRYTVEDSDRDADGVWVQTGVGTRDRVVFLVGRATLTDGDGNAALVTKSGLPTSGDAGHKVDGGRAGDTTPPVLSLATVAGSTLTLRFDEPLKTSAAPRAGTFTLDGDDDNAAVSAVAFKSGDAAALELTLSTAVQPGDAGITVSYARGSDANPLQDPFGNQVADFSGQAVANVTEPPLAAIDDAVATVEDEAVTVRVLANDTAADRSGLRVVSVSAPAHGTAVITAAGEVLYTPRANWHGTDRFTYVIEDGNGATATAVVEVTVTPVNDGPAAVGTIPDQALDEGGEAARVELRPFFEDVDGEELEYRASSSDPSVVEAAVAGSLLTLVPVGYGSATVEVTAADAGGLTAMQTVSVGVTDHAAREAVSHTLAGMARSHLASARTTLGRRASASRPEASRLTLLGRDVPLGADAAKSAAEQMWDGWLSGASSRARSGGEAGLGDLFRFTGGRDPLRGSEFQFALGGAQEAGGGGLRFQLWGQGDVQTFQGAPSDASDYDGELQTGYVGVDTWLSDNWMLGVAVARSRGTGDWRTGGTGGSLETRLVAVHPYLQWSSGATSIWAMAGAGWGDADNVRDRGGRTETSGLGLRMGLVELRRRLAASGGFAFGLRTDAAWAELATDDGTETIDGQTAAVNQLRFGAELSQQLRLGGLTLAPFGEAHVRRDGGDGQPGTGLELIAGLRAQAGFLRIDAQGRMLAVHSVAGYEERGLGLTLSLGSRGGEGPSLSVAPRWGDLASGGGALWQEQVYSRYTPAAADGQTAPNARDGWALDLSGGYGMRMPGGRLLTWSTSVNHSPAGPRFMLGAQLGFGGASGAEPSAEGVMVP